MSNFLGAKGAVNICLLGVRHMNFSGNDGKQVKMSKCWFIDGRAPKSSDGIVGEGFEAIEGKLNEYNLEVHPGYYLAQVDAEEKGRGEDKRVDWTVTPLRLVAPLVLEPEGATNGNGNSNGTKPATAPAGASK